MFCVIRWILIPLDNGYEKVAMAMAMAMTMTMLGFLLDVNW
jgi:hypothetical protein